MSRITVPAEKGVDIILSLDGKSLGGQKNATLNRKVDVQSITNMIECNWSKSIATIKSWNISCNGMVIKNSTAFNTLEQAFIDGTPITVSLSKGNKSYTGEALISNFPITASYNDTLTYNIVLTGTGELDYE